MTQRDKSKAAILKVIELKVSEYPFIKKRLECSSSGDLKLAQNVFAIEDAIQEFCNSPIRREFLKLRFWGPKMPSKEIAKRLDINLQLVTHWKRQFLKLVGEKLGILEKGE